MDVATAGTAALGVADRITGERIAAHGSTESVCMGEYPPLPSFGLATTILIAMADTAEISATALRSGPNGNVVDVIRYVDVIQGVVGCLRDLNSHLHHELVLAVEAVAVPTESTAGCLVAHGASLLQAAMAGLVAVRDLRDAMLLETAATREGGK